MLFALAPVMGIAVPARQDAVPPSPVAAGPGLHQLHLDNVRDGVLYVPPSYKAGTPMPLLVWLHGAGGSGTVSDGLTALSGEFGFLVLAPSAMNTASVAITFA